MVIELRKLTDRYEVKARLLPAFLSSFSVAPIIGALGSEYWAWWAGLPIGGGVSVACAIGLMYVASAAGRFYEKKLWPRWPLDAPTNRWLSPYDTSCSMLQKQLWYHAIERLVGLNIPKVAASDDDEETERVINDAVRNLRHIFRDSHSKGLLDVHNEDYGFARNLGGLYLFWIPASLICAISAWVLYFVFGSGLIWGLGALLVVLFSMALYLILPWYVRQRADRYAESFFGTLIAIDRANGVSNGTETNKQPSRTAL